MEILSYVLDGGLAHRDSLGTGSVIRSGDLQRMSAGTGVRHSEQNASRDEPVHFLQIWITPERRALPPGYEQKRYEPAAKRGRLCLVGSNDGRDGSVTIHQDVSVYATILGPGERVEHRLGQERCAWVQSPPARSSWTAGRWLKATGRQSSRRRRSRWPAPAKAPRSCCSTWLRPVV